MKYPYPLHLVPLSQVQLSRGWMDPSRQWTKKWLHLSRQQGDSPKTYHIAVLSYKLPSDKENYDTANPGLLTNKLALLSDTTHSNGPNTQVMLCAVGHNSSKLPKPFHNWFVSIPVHVGLINLFPISWIQIAQP